MFRSQRRKREAKRRMKQKRGVCLVVPTLDELVTSYIGNLFYQAALYTADPSHPWRYQPYFLNRIYPVHAARNQAVKLMYESDCELLYFIDADMIPPQNWPDLVKPERDISAGITWMWRPDMADTARRLQFNLFKEVQDKTEIIAPKSLTEPFTVDMVGMSCAVIHRRVFDHGQVGRIPYETIQAPDGRRFDGEDINFCRKARWAGFQVTVDPRVVFGHLKAIDLKEVYETIVAGVSATLKGKEARDVGRDAQESRSTPEGPGPRTERSGGGGVDQAEGGQEDQGPGPDRGVGLDRPEGRPEGAKEGQGEGVVRRIVPRTESAQEPLDQAGGGLRR